MSHLPAPLLPLLPAACCLLPLLKHAATCCSLACPDPSHKQVRAIREGREQALPLRDVLVGDLLLVETGDILCTDGLLVAGSDVKCAAFGWPAAWVPGRPVCLCICLAALLACLPVCRPSCPPPSRPPALLLNLRRVDESHLTGEADDVSKDPRTRPSLLGGSKVLSGFGRMLVTAVGPASQSGRIAEMVADGKAGGAAAAAAGMATGAWALRFVLRDAGMLGAVTRAPAHFTQRPIPRRRTAAGDGLREETLLQRKLAEYATAIGKFGLGAAALATVAMTARFRCVC